MANILRKHEIHGTKAWSTSLVGSKTIQGKRATINWLDSARFFQRDFANLLTISPRDIRVRFSVIESSRLATRCKSRNGDRRKRRGKKKKERMEKATRNDRGYAAPESSTIFNCDTSTGAIDSSFPLFHRFSLFSFFPPFSRVRACRYRDFSYFSRLRREASTKTRRRNTADNQNRRERLMNESIRVVAAVGLAHAVVVFVRVYSFPRHGLPSARSCYRDSTGPRVVSRFSLARFSLDAVRRGTRPRASKRASAARKLKWPDRAIRQIRDGKDLIRRLPAWLIRISRMAPRPRYAPSRYQKAPFVRFCRGNCSIAGCINKSRGFDSIFFESRDFSKGIIHVNRWRSISNDETKPFYWGQIRMVSVDKSLKNIAFWWFYSSICWQYCNGEGKWSR